MLDYTKIIDDLKPHIVQHASSLEVASAIHPDDFIFRFLVENPTFSNPGDAVRYYFHDGRKSAENLKNVVSGLGIDTDSEFKLLEFASGYGCVTRHLNGVIPSIDSTACDIHTQAVEFVEQQLGNKSVRSSNVPEQLVVDERFDVVFALSFFSHMPEATWRRWAVALLGLVKPGGYLVFTTQGALSGRRFFDVPKLPSNGFWFQASSEQKDLDTADYGQTLVSSDYVRDAIGQLSDGKLVLTHPGFWWSHQDLYGVQKL